MAIPHKLGKSIAAAATLAICPNLSAEQNITSDYIPPPSERHLKLEMMAESLPSGFRLEEEYPLWKQSLENADLLIALASQHPENASSKVERGNEIYDQVDSAIQTQKDNLDWIKKSFDGLESGKWPESFIWSTSKHYESTKSKLKDAIFSGSPSDVRRALSLTSQAKENASGDRGKTVIAGLGLLFGLVSTFLLGSGRLRRTEFNRSTNH